MKQQVTKLLIGLGFLMTFQSANAVHIVGPRYNGYPLDWCVKFETDCGKPAADLYCQKRGYGGASSFVKRDAVNYSTMTIGQNAICNPTAHRCDSFFSIDCQESTKTFMAPRHNGYRLDWCTQFETGCGAEAAQAFCQKNGFSKMVSFQKQPQLNVSTMTVGSNAVCKPQFHVCDGFSMIRCQK